jgi:predicted ATPase
MTFDEVLTQVRELLQQRGRVTCLCYDALALWYLGYTDQALRKIQEALSLAQERSHPFSLAYALYHTASHHRFRRQEQAAQEWAEKAITLSTEHGFHFWLVLGTIVRGRALAERGQAEEGIGQIRQGLATCRAAGAGIGQTNYLAMLAEGYVQAGQAREGLTTLAEALDLVQKTGEHSHEAELYQLKGELTLQQENQKAKVKGQKSKIETSSQPLTPSTQAEAEACFLKAIDIARKQQAKSWELRAATSLTRLWQQQNKKAEAHKLLSDVYNWFTEGFDTKDLQEARGLLGELGG